MGGADCPFTSGPYFGAAGISVLSIVTSVDPNSEGMVPNVSSAANSLDYRVWCQRVVKLPRGFWARPASAELEYTIVLPVRHRTTKGLSTPTCRKSRLRLTRRKRILVVSSSLERNRNCRHDAEGIRDAVEIVRPPSDPSAAS